MHGGVMRAHVMHAITSLVISLGALRLVKFDE